MLNVEHVRPRTEALIALFLFFIWSSLGYDGSGRCGYGYAHVHSPAREFRLNRKSHGVFTRVFGNRIELASLSLGEIEFVVFFLCYQ